MASRRKLIDRRGARRETLRLAELAGLIPAALPLVVFLLSGILYEAVAFNSTDLAAVIIDNLPEDAEMDGSLILRESAARLSWATSILLYLVVGTGISVAAIRTLRRLAGGYHLLVLGVSGMIIIAVSLAYMMRAADQRMALSGVYYFTHDVLSASSLLPDKSVQIIGLIVNFINGFGVIVPAFLLISGSAVLVAVLPSDAAGRPGPDHAGKDRLLRNSVFKMRNLREIISLGSALMVGGVVHMGAWTRWPAAIVDDPDLIVEIQNASLAVCVYWGATFSLMIATFYLPVAFGISRTAEELLLDPDMPEAERKDWLKNHGLSVMPTQQVPQLTMILAPVVAGPVGAFLSDVGGSLAG